MTPADAALVTPPCPPSEVRDLILTWDEVQPGDLTVYEETFVLALEVTTFEDVYQGQKWMRTDLRYRREDGREFESVMHADRLTAVRRYDTASAWPALLAWLDSQITASAEEHRGWQDCQPGTTLDERVRTLRAVRDEMVRIGRGGR
jgi:hypothetical protein